MILSRGSRLELGEWPPTQAATTSEGGRLATLEEHDREYITSVLDLAGWRVSKESGAAKVLGLKATTLDAKMKKLGIHRKH